MPTTPHPLPYGDDMLRTVANHRQDFGPNGEPFCYNYRTDRGCDDCETIEQATADDDPRRAEILRRIEAFQDANTARAAGLRRAMRPRKGAR